MNWTASMCGRRFAPDGVSLLHFQFTCDVPLDDAGNYSYSVYLKPESIMAGVEEVLGVDRHELIITYSNENGSVKFVSCLYGKIVNGRQ